jgi:hypothetical protein
MKPSVLISCCLFGIFLSSCEKPYHPEDLDTGKKIPVIQGSINNVPGPYTVTLFWASPLGNDRREPIDDASVSISDDLGSLEPLTLTASGTYETSTEGFSGIPGRTYTLDVVLSDGEVYQSTPTTLESPRMTYSLYERIGKEVDYVKNPYGEFLTTTYKGLHYKVDMTLISALQHYYCFNTRMISQFITYTPQHVIYSWKISYLNTLPNIKATMGNNDTLIIKGHELGFIRYKENPAGCALKTRINSVSKEVFEYYQTIIEQLSSNTQIFDPIPSQVTGNIKCLSDPSKTVLGVFEVGELYIRNLGIYWKPGSGIIKQVELSPDYEGPAYDGYTLDDPPDFWVDFD